jgi:hypothetical protein
METRHRFGEELLATSNPTVYWKIRRMRILSCAYCPPHRGQDNPWSRHARTDRYKDVGKGRTAAARSIRDPRYWEVR